MIGSHLRRLGGFALALVLAASGAEAQTAHSFDELQRILKAGQMVVVTDETGRETKGKVADVSPSSLVLLELEITRDGREAWTAKRTFANAVVRKIVLRDSLWNGSLIGLGVGAVPGVILGAGIATYCYNEATECSSLGALIAAGIAAAGAGIGAAIDGARNRVVFVSRQRTPTSRSHQSLGKIDKPCWFPFVSNWRCHASRFYRTIGT